MRHTNDVTWVGQITEPVKLQTVQGTNGPSTVARSRVRMIKKVGQREITQTYFVEAWGPNANRLATIAVGNDVCIGGEVVNESYTDQAGVKKYITKVKAYQFIADLGPSEFSLQQQGTQQHQQPVQQQYGQQHSAQPPAQSPGWNGQGPVNTQPQATSHPRPPIQNLAPQAQAPAQQWTPQNAAAPTFDSNEEIPF